MSGEERVDVLDAGGHPTGETKAKSAVHRDGDWHRSAHVWIVTPGGELLLQRRSESKVNFPGRWDVSAAGHLSAGETAVGAAIRETREELGIEIEPAGLAHLATLREQCVLNGGTYVENEIHEVFVVRREVDPASLAIDRGEVAEVALVAPGELERYDPVPHPEQYAVLLAWLAGGRNPNGE